MRVIGNSHSGADCSPDPEHLITLFNRLFATSENTRLVRGEGEPIYRPADDDCSFHRIEFAHGFFASALHEIAHWCIAGKERRQQLDYGYWYAPDGRDQHQQQAFEQVEVKPQALEWILSRACGKAFRVSVDNLNGVATDPLPFKQAVFAQVQAYCHSGLRGRASELVAELSRFYGTNDALDAQAYSLSELGVTASRCGVAQ